MVDSSTWSLNHNCSKNYTKIRAKKNNYTEKICHLNSGVRGSIFFSHEIQRFIPGWQHCSQVFASNRHKW